MKARITPLGILILVGIGCTQRVDLSAERNAILQIDREWSEAANGDDLDQLLTYWADDAVIYPPGSPAVVGKNAIREFLEQNKRIPGFSISWEPKEVVVSVGGDMAYTLGTTQITANDSEGKPVVHPCKYSVIWRKQIDGSWKGVVDMVNFDHPPLQPIAWDQKEE